MPLATGPTAVTKMIGIVCVSPWRAAVAGGPACQDDIGLQADQLLRERSQPIGVNAGPKIHLHVAAIGPTQVHKRLSECRDATVRLGIIFVVRHEHAYTLHRVGLLRPPPAATPPILLAPR
jgi:hypothetical protein